MKRREFASLAGAAVMLPAAVRGQAMPVIGFLHSGTEEQNVQRVAAFRKALATAGFVEGKNVAIEFRWAGGRNERHVVRYLVKGPEFAANLGGITDGIKRNTVVDKRDL